MATAVATKNECPYCNGKNDKPFYKNFGTALNLIMPDKAIQIIYEDNGKASAYFTEPGVINYCPMCGRKLSDK